MTFQSKFHSSDVVALEVLASGMVVSGGLDGNMAIWDPSTGKSVITSLSVHTSGIYCLKAHPAG